MDSEAQRNWPVIGAVAVLALAVVVLGIAAAVYLLGSDRLEAAAEECSDGGQPSIGDGGSTLTVTSGGRTSAATATTVSACVLDALDAPDSVHSKVAGTTAMMGRQSDSWDGYKLTWTYHPDNGLEIIVETD